MIETTSMSETLAQVADEATDLAELSTYRSLPDGTNREKFGRLAEGMEMVATLGAMTGNLSWSQVASTGFFHILSGQDEKDLRESLVTTAAVLVAWVNDIDNRDAS